MSPVEVASQKQTSLTHLARWGKTGWAYHGLATEKVLPTDGKPGFVNKTERISLAYPHIQNIWQQGITIAGLVYAKIVDPKISQNKWEETHCGYGLVPDWSTCTQNEFEAHGTKWDPRRT